LIAIVAQLVEHSVGNGEVSGSIPDNGSVKKENTKKDILENLVGLAIVIVVIIIAVYFLDFKNIQENILSAGIWAPILLILAKASTLVFAPLSGSALYPIAGAVFGFWPGLLYIFLGDMVGAVISFWISRKFGQKIVEKLLSKKNMPMTKKIISMIETTKGFLFARICFMPMPEIVSYAAGLTKINFWKFFSIQNLVGLIPSIILVGGGQILVSVHNNPTIMFGIIALGFLAIAFGIFLFWKFHKYFLKQDDQ
jgi:uncharacterized membrane protein YdjX (TVP38/TMEM64 family)